MWTNYDQTPFERLSPEEDTSARPGREHRRLARAGQSNQPSAAVDGRGPAERARAAEAGSG